MQNLIGQQKAHSITSSAIASIVGGTVRPSAWAVLRFDDQLELGRQGHRQTLGFSPIVNPAGIDAGQMNGLSGLCAVVGSTSTPRIDCH
jgi:hypothetical protein